MACRNLNPDNQRSWKTQLSLTSYQSFFRETRSCGPQSMEARGNTSSCKTCPKLFQKRIHQPLPLKEAIVLWSKGRIIVMPTTTKLRGMIMKTRMRSDGAAVQGTVTFSTSAAPCECLFMTTVVFLKIVYYPHKKACPQSRHHRDHGCQKRAYHHVRRSCGRHNPSGSNLEASAGAGG